MKFFTYPDSTFFLFWKTLPYYEFKTKSPFMGFLFLEFNFSDQT